jgi:protein SCO1
MNLTLTPTTSQAPDPAKRDWLKWLGGAALAPVLASTSAVQLAHAGPRADYFPNSLVQTHEGKSLRFYDDLVQGKVVVFNMMYSVCTGICPGNTANLRAVQEALGQRLGKDIFMVSMTLQPQFDTPSELKAYVKRYEIGPGWTYITGKPAEMEVIRRRLGFYNSDLTLDADLANHTGMVRIGNEKLDRWFMMPALAKPAQIARAILQT